ncbi:hypothetical protein GLAREA_08647 [Glarea lozoyensis ATCC 20868]|uniref:Cell wall galactomannoprotein n=1 Tax=Glarea lozoyensis (strain ATCC 20868 / MF5171) TaxID=1116229 RepID=S3DH52_GLAL2|nr:uncharacterized protein GLAREA_08647 [Glarea lozoyensis ATCC 20868]EPE36484.1 hypothetical protein GLAREA_08647 [Glarea lozoyensis ATCC 20868]
MVRCYSFLFFGLIATSTAATVAQVADDITALNLKVKKLTKTVNAYQGGFVGALPQLNALVPVYLSLLKGVADTAALPPSVSVTDSYTIIDLVNSTLAVDNPIAIDALVAKKSLYKAAGLNDFLVAAVGLLELGHESFTLNTLKRVPPEASADGIAVTDVITNALLYGIHVFEAN